MVLWLDHGVCQRLRINGTYWTFLQIISVDLSPTSSAAPSLPSHNYPHHPTERKQLAKKQKKQKCGGNMIFFNLRLDHELCRG